jgi:hypothetical protein
MTRDAALVPTLTWSELVDPPCPGRRTTQPLQVALGAVGILEGALGHPAGTPRWRTPSAGGIYPYEVYLASEQAPRLLAHVDLHRRVVTSSPEAAAALAAADGVLYALCGRPWLSMRAYGRRGFLYHMIDLGHALFNAALLCDGGGEQGTRGVKQFTSMVCSVSPTAQIVCIDRLPNAATSGDSNGWRHHVVHTGEILPHRTEYETSHTKALNTASRERLRRLDGSHVAGLREAIEERKSAKYFLDTKDADTPIYDLLEDLPQRISCVTSHLGLPDASIRVLSPEDCADLLPTARDATAAMAQQEHLAPARAYVVFGLDQSRNRAIDRGARRQLLGIGSASELIYLEAARAGTAVTGVGGLDPRIWRQITGIDIPLYLIALGADHETLQGSPVAVKKLDRMNVVA